MKLDLGGVITATIEWRTFRTVGEQCLFAYFFEWGFKMKLGIVLTIFWSLLLLARATEAAQCDRNCLHQQALKKVEAVVADHYKNGPRDETCPAAGIRVQQIRTTMEGSLLSAEGILAQLQKTVKAEAAPVAKDESRCGECQQLNVVSPVNFSRPKSPGVNKSCEGRPTEVVRGEFQSEQEAADYVRATLKGDTTDGERLYAACPDPCSFYIYNAQTQTSSNKTRINLVVQCGQPKGGLFAKYEFGGGYVHEWTCQK